MLKRIVFFSALLILAMTDHAGAQQVDSSCLVPWQDSPLKPQGVVWFNPDSVKVDMCPGTQQYAEFAKNEFVVGFLYFIVPDTMDDSSVRTWKDIDTAYAGIRAGFDSIEQRLGPFTMQLVTPGDTVTAKNWYVNFENYTNTDTGKYYLSLLPEINSFIGANFGGRPLFYEGVNSHLTSPSIDSWPQPCTSEFFVQGVPSSDSISFYDPLGRRIKLPIVSSDGLLTVDVSNQPNGVIYANLSGQFFKILIQK